MNIMRNCFTIGLAGFVIELDTISPRTCIHCMDYLKEGNPDFRIKITEEDVKQELVESGDKRTNEISLETSAAYRKIAEKMLDYSVVLMHGAVVAVGKYSYMFSAPSGTGKTTHAKLWLRKVKNSFIVNGDKPLIIVNDDKLIACGTPWSGSEHMNKNTMVHLKSIVFMERSDTNHIERISFSQAFPYLVQQTYFPRNKEMAKKVLSLLASMHGKASFWLFYCNNFDSECFETSFSALIDNQ